MRKSVTGSGNIFMLMRNNEKNTPPKWKRAALFSWEFMTCMSFVTPYTPDAVSVSGTMDAESVGGSHSRSFVPLKHSTTFCNNFRTFSINKPEKGRASWNVRHVLSSGRSVYRRACAELPDCLAEEQRTHYLSRRRAVLIEESTLRALIINAQPEIATPPPSLERKQRSDGLEESDPAASCFTNYVRVACYGFRNLRRPSHDQCRSSVT